MVWDEGTYEAIDGTEGKKAMEKSLLLQLKAGSLKFKLKGKKLKGEFALVKTKGMAENSWLLIKHRDQYAQEADITKKDKSVLSGKDLSKIAETSQNIYGRKEKTKKTSVAKKTVDKRENEEQEEEDGAGKVGGLLKKGKKASFPKRITPMLATLVNKAFDDPDWEFEVKWDGYRAVAFVDGAKSELRSRNDKSFKDKFYPVFEAVKKISTKMVLDGEIVVVDKKGVSGFNALQNWRSEADGELIYYIFDLLWLEGKSLMVLPLKDRKALLQHFFTGDGNLRLGFSLEGRGKEFLETARKLGLEGIMAKKSDSLYVPGSRSSEWLKIKIEQQQEVIIVGFTHNDGSPKLFSSLLLGAYSNGKLEYAGKVGTGFNAKMQKEMMAQFKPLIIKNSALQEVPDYNKPSRFRPNPPHASVTWLKPTLVCEIKFTEITEDGVFRHPSFKGMRMDKNAKEVIREKEVPTGEALKEAEEEIPKIIKAPEKSGRKTLLNPKDKTQVRKVKGHNLKFTNLDKVYWPEVEVTKRDMLNYYYRIAPFILPYLKGRPQSLNRFPNGIKGKHFFQKDMTGQAPEWIEMFPYASNSKEQDKNYMLATDEASLLYMANLGAIEMNPWSSTAQKPDYPDWCILDLDPGTKNTFEQVIETARVIHEILNVLKVQGYCKTSGSTGLHIYVPLGAQYNYDQSQMFAKLIAREAHKQLLKFTSLERMVDKRQGKLYIDYLQNRPGATLAAPYSLRPKPGATVSMPLQWEEVKPGLKMKDFTIFNALERVAETGDIFKPVLGKGIDLIKVLEAMEKE
jgi:bifunctional non-homologous end joining protein LigD